MLFEGIKLMVMGMLTVMLFLVVMIFCIQIVAWLNKSTTLAEKKQFEVKSKKLSPPTKENQVPVAIFVAAIAAYEAEHAS